MYSELKIFGFFQLFLGYKQALKVNFCTVLINGKYISYKLVTLLSMVVYCEAIMAKI